MEEKTFKLTASNGDTFDIPMSIVEESGMLRSLFRETQITQRSFKLDPDQPQYEGVPEVDSKSIQLILKYYATALQERQSAEKVEKTKDVEPDDEDSEDTMKPWQQEFVKEEVLPRRPLLFLSLVTNYLQFKELKDLVLHEIANRLRTLNQNEIVEFFRAEFPFEGEYTKQEEQRMLDKMNKKTKPNDETD